jgi:predicted transcriptional regulator
MVSVPSMIPSIAEIKLLRKKMNLTQQELAARSGLSQSLIAKIESGKVEPAYSNAVRIFNVLYMAEDSVRGVEEVMHKKIISVSPDTKITKAIEMMKRHGISQLPVIEDGKSVGLVSESIILDAMVEKKGEIVSDIMADAPPIVSQNVNMKVVSQLLRFYPVVLVSEKGRIKGLVTKADMLANF